VRVKAIKQIETNIGEQAENAVPEPQQAVRKQINLEWADSKWFRVWLQLARHQNQEN